MKTLLTILVLFVGAMVIAAPPPPLVRNTYTTNYCTDILINCRGIITANNNTSIVVNSQWNTIDNANIAAQVGGGLGNTISGPGSDTSLISGGNGNSIANGCTDSTIAGGSGNTIAANSTDCFIGGGFINAISGSVINSVVGGGTANLLNNGSSSIIAGGEGNNIDSLGSFCTISGGSGNNIDINGIVGGSTIGGGVQNIGFTNYTTVAGGLENWVFSLAGTIGGGGHNTLATNADHGFIGGGSLNRITNGSYSAICGGSTNCITNGFASFIGGGYDNHTDGSYSYIGAGLSNTVWITNNGIGSSIGGGLYNAVRANRSVIAGGVENVISESVSGYSSIGGGYRNWSVGNFTTIIGGRENTNNSGDYSTILGGYSNRTDGAVSVAGGRSAWANGIGSWMLKDNSAGCYSNSVNDTFQLYFTGAGAEGASIKLGVRDVWMTGTNRNLLATRSDGVVTPLIGLLSDTNRIRSSGANFGVIFNNSSDTLLTRMDNNGNWGFKTNVPQRILHVNGTGTNYAPMWFSQVNTNPPAGGAGVVRYLNIVLDDGLQYTIPLYR